jgi:uncharacterized repeat protein (TIGR01451 family)
LTTRRRILIWAAVTLMAALVVSFPLSAAAFGADEADLSVTQVASDSDGDISSTNEIFAGQVITYTVTVTNLGPSAATGVSVTAVPADIDTSTLESCVSACTNDANFTEYASGTEIVLGDIGAAEGSNSKELVFRGRITASKLPGSVTNTVSASSAQTDPDTTNSTDVVFSTPVDTLADLSVSQVAKDSAGKAIDTTNRVRAGDVITYVATVKNAGPSLARNVKIKDTFDSGVTNLQSCVGACSAESAFSSYQSSSLLSLGGLGAGATKTVSFRGTLPSTITAATEITNVVSAKSFKTDTTGATADSDSADATSTITTTVYKAKAASSSNNNSSTTGTNTVIPSSTAGVYFGAVGAPTYFEPQQSTKTVVIKKVIYQSAFGRGIPTEASAPIVETATQQAVIAPVANRIVRAPEAVWLLLPVGLLLIIWVTYLVIEPYEDQFLGRRTRSYLLRAARASL